MEWFKPAFSSILNKTIPDLLSISENEKNLIRDSFERSFLSELDITSEAWNRLNYYCIYEGDTVDYILPLSIGYLYKILENEIYFNNILKDILHLISNLLGRKVYLIIEDICDKELFLINDKVELPQCEPDVLRDLIISPALVPKRIVVKLQKHGLSKWNDIWEFSEYTIINRFGLNGKAIDMIGCLRDLYPYAMEHYKHIINIVNNKKQYKSFKSFIKEWILHKVNRDYHAEIIMMRMGLGCDDPKTLEEVGQQYGITKERVRQIVRAYLERPRKRSSFNKEYFYAFNMVIDAFLQSLSGIASFDVLSESVQNYFKWEKKPSFLGLQNIISFAPTGMFSKEVYSNDLRILTSNNFICNDCSELSKHFIDFVERHKETSIIRAMEFVNTYCKNKCQNDDKLFIKFNQDFIGFLLARNQTFKEVIRKKDGTLYHIDTWNIKYGRLIIAAETILKQSRRPMHFTEVFEELGKLRSNAHLLSARNIHATMDRSQNLLLWDRGTFIHHEHCKFPLELIDEIQGWILLKLKNNLPFISVGGIFNHFRERCITNGIPSETALYICLRKNSHNMLVAPHYPKMYLADSFTEKLPNSVIIEEFLRGAGGPMPHKELKNYFLKSIGLKSFQLDQILSNDANLIRVSSNRYVHFDNLVFDKKSFKLHFEELLLSTISKIKASHISIRKVFEDKIISYKNMGVDSPEMLHSLLKLNSSEKFIVEGFPQIRLSGKKQFKGAGFRNACIEYVKDKNDFCTISELEEYFVNQLGYNPQTVCMIRYSKEIYNYMRGAIVHTETLEWNSEKQNQLENVALEEYYEAIRINSFYGLIDNILESKNLPTLANNIYFTKLLISDLLNESSNWLILGNAQNAYMPIDNKYNISSFEDLVYMILKDQYNGAANLEQFQDDLADLGIIQKRLTPPMLGNSKKVIIAGQEIMLTELVSNV